MFQRLDHRGCHYVLLIAAWAAVSLPNLGAPGLWDIDEGNNAVAAYEMRESGSPIVPTFDYQLRVDKPPLLYWLQWAAYAAFGVNEFAARLPSALAALAAVLVTYELGRKTFGATTGLLAGLLLASATLFCASARFANPDALLDACTVLSLFVFWLGYRKGGPLPFGTTGFIAGVGMLAKGPVALVLPTAVSVLFLAWQRQLRRLLDVRFGWGVLTFTLVAAPWYTWVGVETKGLWLQGFFVTHNIGRALGTMENHGGPFFYYALVLLVGFAPWSIFLAPAVQQLGSRDAAAEARAAPAAQRFLLCWIAVYVVFFSIARTKLPNYILPVYPAVALLVARPLEAWRSGRATLPGWMLPASQACLALVGVSIAVGALVAAGVLPAGVPARRQLPAVAPLALGGLIPLGGALLGTLCLRRGARNGFVGAMVGCGILLTATLAAVGPLAVDRYKAPRALAAALPADQTERDVRITTYEYFQPSLVFYCHREVRRCTDETEVKAVLAGPLPTFVFLPARVWDGLNGKTAGHEIARHHDLYDACEIVLVGNESSDARTAVAAVHRP